MLPLKRQTLYTYLHLAPDPQTKTLLLVEFRATCIAYETVKPMFKNGFTPACPNE